MAHLEEEAVISRTACVTHRPAPSDEPLSANGSFRQNRSAVPKKRLLGAYYTPDELARTLCRWALTRHDRTVLDPSFGGCAFLAAAAQVLARKGADDPGRLVFGVDVDADCMAYVRCKDGLVEQNCLVGDFLGLTPGRVPGTPFQAIVGNPPYVRHHWLNGSMRKAARSLSDTSGITLSARASSWAYFLVHALGFLDKGGRIAMLVPEAILQADYAGPIREALARRFSRVLLIHIRDRLFERSDEPVVVVAASGFGKPGKMGIESIERAEDLERVLKGSKAQQSSSIVTLENGRTVPTSVVRLLKKLEQHNLVRYLADLATVRIGFVTGANNHFIRSAEDLDRLDIPRKTRLPVVARTNWLSGLEFTKQDHQTLVGAGRRAFLVLPAPKHDHHPGVQRWIEEGEACGVPDRFKCSQRPDWFRVEVSAAPDAFATCTRLGSPRLVINASGCFCSNALHSVRWKSGVDVAPHAVALGFLTSVVAAWAELHGRRYGGGVLKIEPSILNRVPVPLFPGSTIAYDEIEGLLRKGREEEARRRADEVVLGDGLKLKATDVRRLQRACASLAEHRRPAADGGRRG